MSYTDYDIRMKRYEKVTDIKLVPNSPVIIRVEGRAFHTLTRKFDKPFDEIFRTSMEYTTMQLCKNIQNCVIAYTQSDEISLLLVDYINIEQNQMFDGRVQKLSSIAASIATYSFNEKMNELADFHPDKVYKNVLSQTIPLFDARAYNIPKDEVCNYFLWRQKDCTKNSISMIARCHFSAQSMKGQTREVLKERLLNSEGINIEKDFEHRYLYGSCCIKIDGTWTIDKNIPKFNENRDYIESLVYYE